MLRLRTLLVDDEPLALDLLQVECDRVGFVEVVGVARDGISAAGAIETLRPDLVLLDVEMPGLNGLAVAAGARTPAPQIIFVTAHPAYAVEAFGLEATDYLLKPIARDRLAMALDRARRRLRPDEDLSDGEAGSNAEAPAEADAIWLNGRQGYVRLPHDSIQWIEAQRDYMLLHTATRSYIHRATLRAMRQRLGEEEMLQVNRSVVVRRSAIDGIYPASRGGLRLALAGGAELNVGRRYLASVTTALGLPRGRRRR